MEQPINGSCLCGDVAFTVQPPFVFFQYCHCSRCRKLSGSAHAANIFVKLSQFAWTKGEATVQRFELPAAEYFCSGFCPRCGSSMPWLNRSGKYMLIPAGSLDEDPGARPDRNIYWGSRAPWYVPAGELPIFEEGPPR